MNSLEHEEAKEYKERLHIALKAAKICVFEVDLIRRLYTFFENAEDIFGVSGDVILNDVRPFSKLEPAAYQKAVMDYFSHPDDERAINQAFHSILSGRTTTYEARMRAGGSGYLWCKIDVMPVMKNQMPVKMIGVITDISNLKTKTDQLENAVKLDAFTGLYNKKYAIGMIRDLMSRRPGQRHALVLLDIDNFKSFNDTYGHALGDEAILLVAGSLKRSFRKTDVVGRFGGDEFIIFIQDIPNDQWLEKKLRRLTHFKDCRFGCTGSVGIAVFSQDGTDFNALFKKADQALYLSKQRKESFCFYSESKRNGPSGANSR